MNAVQINLLNQTIHTNMSIATTCAMINCLAAAAVNNNSSPSDREPSTTELVIGFLVIILFIASVIAIVCW